MADRCYRSKQKDSASAWLSLWRMQWEGNVMFLSFFTPFPPNSSVHSSIFFMWSWLCRGNNNWCGYLCLLNDLCLNASSLSCGAFVESTCINKKYAIFRNRDVICCFVYFYWTKHKVVYTLFCVWLSLHINLFLLLSICA